MRGGIHLDRVINFIKAHLLQITLVAAISLAVLAIIIILIIILKKRKKSVPMEVNLSSINVGNVHNIGKRESQQDSFGVSDLSNEKQCRENGIFAVVADGMGGLAGGAEISAIVTSYMLSYFSKANHHKDIPTTLLDMVYGANREVRQYLNNNGNQLSGSTVVAAVIKDNLLHFLTVGDSRIYLCRGGVMLQLNREHTYGSELDEKAARGEISISDAKGDPQRNALTSYIGLEEITHIDRSLRPVSLAPGDRVFLMSDGVFGTLSEDEILRASSANLYETTACIEKAILDKGKMNQDNFTSVIIEIK